jgi:hypothetical protein
MITVMRLLMLPKRPLSSMIVLAMLLALRFFVSELAENRTCADIKLELNKDSSE